MIELLAILAVFRLTRLFVVDDGPGDVLLRLRVKAGVYDLGQNGEPVTWTGRLLACPFCTGIWCAVPVALLLAVQTLPGDVVLFWLGLAGGQTLLELVTCR